VRRRNWFVAAIVIGVAAIVIAALVVRLTEDDGQPSATAWADSVCSSLVTWKSSIEALADVSGGTLTPESLAEKIDAAETATSTLVSELKGLGAPDLESGDELQQQLQTSADELQSSVETLKQSAEEAASSDEFLQSLAALAPQFQALLDGASATVDDLENANVGEDAKAELQAAFAGSEPCQELQGSG
jgi:hypothetical protein